MEPAFAPMDVFPIPDYKQDIAAGRLEMICDLRLTARRETGSSGGADEDGAEEAVRAVEVGCGPEESFGVDEGRGDGFGR
jgi:hypothetical protein